MADQTPGPISTPSDGPNSEPNFAILDKRISKALDDLGVVSGGGGGHMGGVPADDGRLSKLENEVHAIKGSLDWAKIAFSMLLAVTLGGFAILIALTLNITFNLSSKIDSISIKRGFVGEIALTA
jgi:hypothetical protein